MERRWDPGGTVYGSLQCDTAAAAPSRSLALSLSLSHSFKVTLGELLRAPTQITSCDLWRLVDCLCITPPRRVTPRKKKTRGPKMVESRSGRSKITSCESVGNVSTDTNLYSSTNESTGSESSARFKRITVFSDAARLIIQFI